MDVSCLEFVSDTHQSFTKFPQNVKNVVGFEYECVYSVHGMKYTSEDLFIQEARLLPSKKRVPSLFAPGGWHYC